MELPDLLFHVLRHNAMLIGQAADAPGLKHFKDLHAVDKRGRFAEDHIAGIDEDLAEQIHCLEAAVHDQDIVGGGGNTFGRQQFFGNGFPQLLHALDGTVLQCFHTACLSFQHLVGDRAHLLDRQRVRSGGSAAEGDRLRVIHGAEQASDDARRPGHIFHSFCKFRHFSAPVSELFFTENTPGVSSGGVPAYAVPAQL